MAETNVAALQREYMRFWREHFPEQTRMSREEAWLRVNDRERGLLNARQTEAERVSYQNDVATVYGAYERSGFQEATMGRILSHIDFPKEMLVSFGSGPGSYELWLLATKRVEYVALVDHSPAMLMRARSIAERIGVTDQVTYSVCDVKIESTLSDDAFDVVFSINAMHWDQEWRMWIRRCARAAKNGADAFFTCSLRLPHTDIRVPRLVHAAERQFYVRERGLLVPPTAAGHGMAEISSRYFMACRRKKR